MPRGIDTPQNCRSKITCIKDAGYKFVIRYYNVNRPAKNLTLPEAQVISRADLQIVVVWENGFPTTGTYFSHSKGVHDGTLAYHYAMHEIGQPANSPIYFGVDYDASNADISGGIRDYFIGIRDGFNTISLGNPIHPIGVYGSGAVCSWLLSRQQVQYTWLAQSTGWSGYRTFTQWNIKQGPEGTICDLDADPDDSIDNYGGFQI